MPRPHADAGFTFADKYVTMEGQRDMFGPANCPQNPGIGMSEAEEPLLIKRYASRRLYNSETSEYVTVQEIADFIRAGRDVRIVDRKTGDDLTRQYLVQIIADHESRGEEILPLNVLMAAVRTYNDQAGDVVPKFLDMAFQFLRKSQDQVMESVQAMSDPMYAMREFERQQREAFSSFMNYWSTGGQGQDQEPETASEDSSGDETELEAIKKQLAELQAKVSNL